MAKKQQQDSSVPALPHVMDETTYWRDVYSQPLPFWHGALKSVAMGQNYYSDGWERASLGRNVVFLNDEIVVKLGPPCWSGEMAREAAALQYVASRLPIATPPLVALGTIDGWDYLIQKRMVGTNLRDLWDGLDSAERANLAYQHGELMAAVHMLPIESTPSVLRFDWTAMLREQRLACAADMAEAGVEPALVAQVDPYLQAIAPMLMDDTHTVLLHGDLTHLNLLVERQGGSWSIIGLIDWGDAKLGPRSHEFISPGVHMYRGDQLALEHWYRGYGLEVGAGMALFEPLVMARAMLYYGGEFAGLLQTIPGVAGSVDWETVAHHFWHMSK